MGSERRTESREAGPEGRTCSREVYEASLLSGLKGAEKHQSCHSECLAGQAGGMLYRQGCLPGPSTWASEGKKSLSYRKLLLFSCSVVSDFL